MSNFEVSNTMSDYQTLIHQSRYARWLDSEGRRETWDETCQRYADFWDDKVDLATKSEIFNMIRDMQVMPSMRALWAAGPALARDHAAGYNCSYVAIDHPRAFDSIFYLLMCGAGAGFSVERQSISKLPEVAEELVDTETTIVVRDSKIGWATAFKQLISMLYSGEIPRWDVSGVRPAGARLKTMGGRASGPAPLVDLFEFTVRVFQGAAGRKLSSTEAHDILTKTGEVTIMGSVRRSAMISLGNLSDDRHRSLKTGEWWKHDPQRALANNSAVYTEKPDFQVFQSEMKSLYESYSGERGIFNRAGAQKKIAAEGIRESDHDFGVNPCAEIILKSAGLCNLTEVIIRPEDTLETLKYKVKYAAIMGTLQSSLTDFRHLPSKWKKNAEDERLLGLSFTGICDHPVMAGKKGEKILTDWLKDLRAVATSVNKEWAKKLGINPSASITTVKPSGTVSQLCDTASGIHPRFSKFYIRTIRQDVKDPLTDFLIAQGVPNEPCVMKPDSTVIFSFPMKSPKTALTVSEVGSIEQLELAKLYGDVWASHTVSLTAYYTDDTWFDVCSWIWNPRNWDSMVGMSFLPHDGGTYKQAPYQECDAETYKAAVKAMPSINWDELQAFEQSDNTTGSQTLACVGDKCEWGV
jgi:ribonucleoside-diphosphate reductase alpha chain